MSDQIPRYVLEGSAIEGDKIIANGNTTKQKHWCPDCGKRRFTRFVDVKTGAYLPERFGRCDRENNCAYYHHPRDEQYTPSGDGLERVVKKPAAPKKPSHIPRPQARNTFDPESNKLYQFMTTLFRKERVAKVFELYGVGTDHTKWPGASVFYQIDTAGSVRGGKVMDYGPDGHRIKNRCGWIHSIWGYKDFHLVQCLFGLHLVRKYPNWTICVVESEKTALIASIYYPQYLWLATGGLSNKPVEKCRAISDQQVLLVPDIGATDKWKAVARELNQHAKGGFLVFDFLEHFREQAEGYDIADFIENTIREEAQDSTDNGQLRSEADKYHYMKRKNPEMGKLRSTLGLTVDDNSQV